MHFCTPVKSSHLPIRACQCWSQGPVRDLNALLPLVHNPSLRNARARYLALRAEGKVGGTRRIAMAASRRCILWRAMRGLFKTESCEDVLSDEVWSSNTFWHCWKDVHWFSIATFQVNPRWSSWNTWFGWDELRMTFTKFIQNLARYSVPWNPKEKSTNIAFALVQANNQPCFN